VQVSTSSDEINDWIRARIKKWEMAEAVELRVNIIAVRLKTHVASDVIV
jgi:hypothetical protein